ncbi:MAG: squalene/phytoene synthase family protein [Hyphomicrobiales bacterium]
MPRPPVPASPELAAMIGRLLAEADRLYDRATAGIDLLPLACRPAIHASRLLYAEIGREVERAAHDSVAQRAVVSTGRKSLLMCAALVSSMARRSQPAPEILPEASLGPGRGGIAAARSSARAALMRGPRAGRAVHVAGKASQ